MGRASLTDRLGFAPGYTDAFFGGDKACADDGSRSETQIGLAEEHMAGNTRTISKAINNEPLNRI